MGRSSRVAVGIFVAVAGCAVNQGMPAIELTATTTVLPGAICAAGGVAIATGQDLNGDGVLEPDEITNTTYTCTPPTRATTVNGNVVIHTQADVDALVHVTTITGTLTVDSTTLTAVRVPSLVSVGGFMCAEDATAPCTLTTLSLPALQIVTNAITVDDYHLTTFDLPLLRKATYVFLSNMNRVSLPSLQSCSQGNFSFTSNSQPTAISLPVLTTCDLVMEWTGPDLDLSSFTSGRLQIDEATTPVLSLPSMTSGDIDISDTSIASIEVPVLASGSVSLTADDAMTAVDLGSLTSGALLFQDNKKLASVTVSASAVVSQLIIMNNYSFPTCAAMALWTELGQPPGQISNNDSTAMCR